MEKLDLEYEESAQQGHLTRLESPQAKNDGERIQKYQNIRELGDVFD